MSVANYIRACQDLGYDPMVRFLSVRKRRAGGMIVDFTAAKPDEALRLWGQIRKWPGKYFPGPKLRRFLATVYPSVRM